MAKYECKDLRNIALCGHAGSGKTMLAEAMLFKAGVLNRLGSIDGGSTATREYNALHSLANGGLTNPADYAAMQVLLDLESFTDRAGNTTTITYNDRHDLIEIFDPLGNRAVRSDYDESGRLIATTNAAGNTISFEHDQKIVHFPLRPVKSCG